MLFENSLSSVPGCLLSSFVVCCLLFAVCCLLRQDSHKNNRVLGPEQLNSLAYNGNGNGNGNKQHRQQLRAICLFNLI